MTPLGHRIASVLWSIRKGESGFGWVAAVGTVRWGDSREEAANSPFLPSNSLSSPCYGTICPHKPSPGPRNFKLLTQEFTLQEV